MNTAIKFTSLLDFQFTRREEFFTGERKGGVKCMDRLRKVLEESPLVVGVLLALFGGTVRGMGKRREHFTVWGFLYRVGAAAFVGLLMGLVMSYTRYDPKIEAAIIGGSGYAAIDLLEYLPTLIKDKIKRGVDKM